MRLRSILFGLSAMGAGLVGLLLWTRRAQAKAEAGGEAADEGGVAVKGEREGKRIEEGANYIDPEWPQWVRQQVAASSWKTKEQRIKYAKDIVKGAKQRAKGEAAALAMKGAAATNPKSWASLFEKATALSATVGAAQKTYARLHPCPRGQAVQVAWPRGSSWTTAIPGEGYKGRVFTIGSAAEFATWIGRAATGATRKVVVEAVEDAPASWWAAYARFVASAKQITFKCASVEDAG